MNEVIIRLFPFLIGIILLDANGDNFPAIVDKIVDQLVESGQLKESEVDFVLQALYKKHRL